MRSQQLIMDGGEIDDQQQTVLHVTVNPPQKIGAAQFLFNEAGYLFSIRRLRLFPNLLWLLLFAETLIIGGFILKRIIRILHPHRDRRYIQILRSSRHGQVATLMETQYILHGRRFRLSWWKLVYPIVLYILICLLCYQTSSLKSIFVLMYDPQSLYQQYILPYHPMKDVYL